jgi:DNA-binding NtrC family response regulator
LRERQEDIEPLSAHSITKLAATEGKAVCCLTEIALDLLKGFDWPGNVRQLENAIFRALVLCDGDELKLSESCKFSKAVGMGTPTALNGRGMGALPALNGTGEVRRLSVMEADIIPLVIDKYDGQMTEFVRRLGIDRSNLYRKVAEFGIDVERRPGRERLANMSETLTFTDART